VAIISAHAARPPHRDVRHRQEHAAGGARRPGAPERDTDQGGYYEEVDGERLWRVDRITALLDDATADDDDRILFVQARRATRGAPTPRFDAIVRLSAPPEVLSVRLSARTNNP
jgi:hypothetical protein